MNPQNYTKANYTVTIELSKTPEKVFDHLVNDVHGYWPEEMEGKCTHLNDEFVFRSGDSHYSKNKVVELVPNKRMVWLVTASLRKPDNYDWTGTKMIFDLIPNGATTLLKFTYDGIVLQDEYDRLVQVCDMVIKGNLYTLIDKSYTTAITVGKSAHEVFVTITNDIAKWWGGNDLKGNHTKLNDEFTIDHPGAHYSKQKLIELIPNKKVAWLITEATLPWLKNEQEWTNTKLIFELTEDGPNMTTVHFTHLGLTPEKECYARCSSEGWGKVIKDYLYNFIQQGKAHFI